MKIFTLSIFLFLGLSAFSVNYYVDSAAMGTHKGTSWATAFDSLQPALKVAGNGDTVFVAKGTYLPTNTTDRSKYFSLPSGVRLLGGYPTGGGTRDIEQYKTILSANIGSATADTDNAFHVLFCNMSSPGTEINGLYLTGGYADGVGDDANGGGIYVKNRTSRYYHVTITDCRIYGNYAAGGGGGINITQKGDIYHCVIRDNRSKGAGGGLMLIDDARAYNSLIINNYSEGGGGGVYLKGFNTSPGLFGCVISNNETPGDGAGIFQDHDGRVYNCTITRNKGKSGYYYGIYSWVANNIVWGNSGNQINMNRIQDLHHCAIGDPAADLSASDKSIVLDSVNTGVSDTTNYCAFRNPPDSMGNVSTSEGRKNVFQADWRLNPGSACINGGDNSLDPKTPLNLDFYQNPRFTDSIIDIGAAEAVINLRADSVLVKGDSARFFGTVIFSTDSAKTVRGFSYGTDPGVLTDVVADSGTGAYSAWSAHDLVPATYYYRAWGMIDNIRYPGFIKTFLVCSSDTTKESAKICQGDSYTFPDDSTWDNITRDTTHTSHLTAANGCDSLVTTFVAVNHVNTEVSLHGDTLVARAGSAKYQWLNCNHGHSIISGATKQSFTPEQNGIYAVEITQNACVDTSSCYTVSTVGIAKNSLGKDITIHPNPTSGKIFIRSAILTQKARIEVLNTLGQVVMQQERATKPLDLSSLNNGLYFIRITDKGHQLVKKILLRKR